MWIQRPTDDVTLNCLLLTDIFRKKNQTLLSTLSWYESTEVKEWIKPRKVSGLDRKYYQVRFDKSNNFFNKTTMEETRLMVSHGSNIHPILGVGSGSYGQVKFEKIYSSFQLW